MALPTAVRAIIPLAGGFLALAHFGLDHSGRAIAVATAMVLAWLFESLHPAIVGFIGAFLFRATEAAEFETAFGGFATALPWLLFGVLLLVTAAEHGGLSRLISNALPPAVTASPMTACLLIIATAFVLSWVIPHALARAAILILLASAIAPAGTEWRAQIGAVAAMAAALFETHLSGSAAVLMNAGSAIALVGAALLLCRPVGTADRTPPASTPLDVAVVAIVVLTLLLWASAPYHRFQPELVGLGAGLLCAIVALGRGWKGVTADPLAMILAGTALSIPGVLEETGAIAPLVGSVHHAASMLALPAPLADYWAWAGLRLFMLDPAAAAASASPGAWTIATSAASTTLFAIHQSPALALAMAMCGSRTRHILILGGVVFAARSLLVLVL